ncbi:MAG: dTDP-4-dehydrorhamnose reductase [Paraeggerthella hongkongensis]|uniref:dTDP-4-dehydrorhamnose reductase n=1 Tax=Paraeggerthella sp. Marseille-Q4926 TaxID=2866587 RepID=UPI001CE3D1BD|nr:dTDP-4-dehydrorhamnose reductase [Paraeggerthella sp. Marseille-Q4926]
MRILVTGGSGQLGNEIRRCLETMGAEIGPIPEAYAGASAEYVDYDALDVSDGAAVAAWFSERGPYDLVVNCAAVTNVDGCEKNEAGAYRVNAHGAEHLARACEACGAKLVHVSTDYVFPGDDPEPREEGDPVGPISAYGRTKWAGEVLATDACSRAFVVRTAWLYGYVGGNFAKTMMRLARERGRISVVADQLGNPTSANDLAYEILRIAQTEDYGTYHCTNEGTCSWFDFACAVVDGAGIPCEKEGLTSSEYKERFPQSADRPAYSSLRNKRLEDTIGNDMRPWREALATYLERLLRIGG